MENTLTQAQYDALPAELQGYYERSGDEYTLKKDRAGQLLLAFLLLLLTRKQEPGPALRNQMKLFSIIFGRKLAADTRTFMLTDPTKAQIRSFMRQKQAEVSKVHRQIAEVAINSNDTRGRGLIRKVVAAGAIAYGVKQVIYFSNFIKQVVAGSHKLSPGRMAMYGVATYTTFQNADRSIKTKTGVSQERRYLGIAEHCPTCVTEADKGWQPIGTLREIGDSECLSNCRCRFDYK